VKKPIALLEPMDMPDPDFPIKVNYCRASEYGEIVFPTHWHKHLEILFIQSGTVSVECNSVPFTAQKGDLILMNSNDLHSGYSVSDDLYYYALIFDPSLLHSASFDAVETRFITPIIQNHIVFRNKIAQDEEINSCIYQLVQELEDREVGYELSIKSHLFRILTLLLRKHVSDNHLVSGYHQRRNNLERFYPVLRYIEEHYNKELTVAQLAEQAGLSRFHFSRLFKELTDRTVIEYINAIRLHRAEYLLHNTTMTISEIALFVGFHDIYYFSRTFKKVKHFSPSELRRSLQS